jgi:hypothetical protein
MTETFAEEMERISTEVTSSPRMKDEPMCPTCGSVDIDYLGDSGSVFFNDGDVDDDLREDYKCLTCGELF